MPKHEMDELQGYNYQVTFLEVPTLDQHGQPIVNGDGPVMMDMVVLSFVEKRPDGGKHVVTIRLDLAGRDELVSMLTGGIYVASELPPSSAA